MGNARRCLLTSLEVLFCDGIDIDSRAVDFSVPRGERLWRTPIASRMVYRGIFGNDPFSIDGPVRRLFRAAVQSDFPAWELCRSDDGQSILSGDVSHSGLPGGATWPKWTRESAADFSDSVFAARSMGFVSAVDWRDPQFERKGKLVRKGADNHFVSDDLRNLLCP